MSDFNSSFTRKSYVTCLSFMSPFANTNPAMHSIKLHVILLLVICLVLVVAKPMPSQAEIYGTATTTSPAEEPTFTIAKRRRTYNCDQDDRLKKIEAQAWADAGAMAVLAEQWDGKNSKWQPAMHYWMGFDAADTENYWKISM